MIFVDTSGWYALMDRDDAFHAEARDHWEQSTQEAGPPALATTNYVLLETHALVQRRLGMDALRAFLSDLLPISEVHVVDEDTHDDGVVALLNANRRDLSLVDCTSFEMMRALQIDTAFTFDKHFAEQGFECVPANVKGRS